MKQFELTCYQESIIENCDSFVTAIYNKAFDFLNKELFEGALTSEIPLTA